MKKESDLWKLLKKNTPQIKWTRLESWSSFGTPDLLGYHDTCGFFMCELKLVHDNKIHFSPHQILFHSTMTKRNFILVGQSPKGSPRSIKLYGSSSILGLLEDQREVAPVAQDDWAHINRLLIGASCSWAVACWLARALACWLARARSLQSPGAALLALCNMWGASNPLMLAVTYIWNWSVPALSTATAAVVLFGSRTGRLALLACHGRRPRPEINWPLVYHVRRHTNY